MANFLKPVRRNAGLGNPPEPYFNNLPESGNAVVKRAVNYQPNEMSHFCMEMEELIAQQKRDCEAAILNRGPYMLSEEFKSLQIPPEKWFEMNSNQREVALQKFWKTQLPSLNQDDDQQGIRDTLNWISHSSLVFFQLILKRQGWRAYLSCC